MKYFLRHTNLLALTVILSACAITPDRSQERILDKDLARVELEKSHRIPNLFSEHWFGSLVRVRDLSGRIIFTADRQSDDEDRNRILDLIPGTYNLLVLCRTHTPFKGSGSSKLASKQVTLTAGETRKLACEPFEYEEKSPSKKSDKKRIFFEVRLVDA